MRIELPNLLLIAGNSRNVGKTNLALRLIGEYAARYPIIGLKVSAIYPGDSSMHGIHPEGEPDTFSLFRETDYNTTKDTSRFLQAGAVSSWFLRAKDEYLTEGLQYLLKEMGNHALVVCESRSLIRVVKPGLFILIEKHREGIQTKDVSLLVPLADIRIITGAGKYDTEEVMSSIGVSEKGSWVLKGPQKWVYL